MKRPNFFIVGAPKCGTTALYECLQQHPQIYFPDLKEPHYFASDLYGWRSWFVSDLAQYLQLYAAAPQDVLACGDASVWYLYSDCAIRNILDFDAAAKFIVALRSPLDLVQSLHGHRLFYGEALERSFEKAWRRADRAVAPPHTPPACQQLYDLRNVGQIGKQVARLVQTAPRTQVHFVNFDHLIRRPQEVFLSVTRFLGLPDHLPARLDRTNATFAPRSTWLSTITSRPPAWMLKLEQRVKSVTGLNSLGVSELLLQINRGALRRNTLPEDVRREIVEWFRKDIELLSHLTQENLSHWTRIPDETR